MSRADRPVLGILLIVLGVTAISVNDFLIKRLSGEYPLHQIVFVRSGVGLMFSLVILQFEGGFARLRTATPGLHVLRGLFVVSANMTFYAAVAVLPLAQATALFFVAPLFITLLSIPFLGERVGPVRLLAVLVGFGGVVLMQMPEAGPARMLPMVVFLLPVAAAFLYASMQVLTRKLGASAPAAALAVYIQSTFLLVSALFFLVAGDGRFADGTSNASLQFLLRAWTWPAPADLPIFATLGLVAGVVGYCLSAAYRLANASIIAPFEYLGLPLAIFWGWLVFGEWPGVMTWAGSALIVAAGLVVFFREGARPRPNRAARR
ncbi:Riboflavin transporter [Roseivivax sp. THAF40]|uniref:DMT family transporter n=1 Tax=unclassified Roseivivax TaxID=2639302 RepID=UPI001268EB8E|nr:MULTISPECIES: DMT family transporter [unclassified Roseivivax]QFS81596.1 Riboflavin transporter [Roseivivax sp. THAF197b]QFT45325.1 Riboflavin transporter [Roseivivax sp. THAF40]